MTKDELREKIRNGYKPTKEDYLAVMDEEQKTLILAKEELKSKNGLVIMIGL